MAAASTSAASSGGGGGSSKSTKTKTATKASGAGTKAKKPAARRKKPTTKSASVSSNQATFNAARSAQIELAQQRGHVAAKKSDPLWYNIEDLLPVTRVETAMAESASVLPEQIQVVEAALSHNHMTRSDVTPQAFACLLEQSRRYALEILADAQDYANLACRSEITKPDLLMASEMRRDHPLAVSTQLPKLNLLARQINRKPLPPIPTQCYSGVLLPPKHHQLTARTFDVVSGAHVAKRMIQPAPSAPNSGRKSSSSKSNKPSYGAARGRQIPINLKKDSGAAEDTASSTNMSATTSSGTGGGPAPMDTSVSAP